MHAPRTVTLPIGRPSDERMPLSRAIREAGTRATSNDPLTGKRVSQLSTTSPPGLTFCRISGAGGDGETTTSTSHSRTLYRRWIGASSSQRRKAEIGAPRRSALNSGKLCAQ